MKLLTFQKLKSSNIYDGGNAEFHRPCFVDISILKIDEVDVFILTSKLHCSELRKRFKSTDDLDIAQPLPTGLLLFLFGGRTIAVFMICMNLPPNFLPNTVIVL